MELIRTFSNPIIKDTWAKGIKETVDFIIDDFGPLCINSLGDNYYMILFFATQYSTEETIYLQLNIKAENKHDIEFLDSNPINMNNIINNKDRLRYYDIHTQNASNNKICLTDMVMSELQSKPYFLSNSYIKSDDGLIELDLYFNRDIFIKFNIYIRSFLLRNNAGEIVFSDPKFRNMKFSTVNHSKLDGSGTDINGDLVFSHYTCGNGPELYKFINISKKIPNRKLLKPMNMEVFKQIYGNSFILNDIIYEPTNDCLYVIYEVKSDITGKYKETKVLRFYKEFYERTDLVDIKKIYEKENDKDEESNN